MTSTDDTSTASSTVVPDSNMTPMGSTICRAAFVERAVLIHESFLSHASHHPGDPWPWPERIMVDPKMEFYQPGTAPWSMDFTFEKDVSAVLREEKEKTATNGQS